MSAGSIAGAILVACAGPAPTATAVPPKPAEPPKPAPAPTATIAPAKPAAEAAKPAEAPKPAEKPAEKPAAAAPSSGSGLMKVVFWSAHSGNTEKAQAELARRFNTSQSKYQVDAQYQGSYTDIMTKMQAAMAAKQVPDIFLIHEAGWLPFWLNKQLEPLDKYVADTKMDVSDWQDALYKEGVKFGKLWWLSTSRSTPIFYYNREAWAEAGLPDRPPKTWTELLEWAPKLTKKSGSDTTQFAHQEHIADSSPWVLQTKLWQWGGRYSNDEDGIKVTIADPPAIAAIQAISDMIHKSKAARVDPGPNGERAPFLGGKSASLINSTSQLVSMGKSAKFKVGVGFLPEGPAGFGCTTGGSGMAIPAMVAGDKKPAAFEWLKFSTDTESTVYWLKETGYMPLRKSAEKHPDVVKLFADDPNFQVAVSQLPKSRFQEYARIAIAKGDSIINKGLSRVAVSNEPVEAVMKEVADELDKELRPVRELVKVAASY
ncbi:MAG: ABC transporter substrate-binding protein [Chloroflexota bacterium]|nr:MAG: ABC transporter substrate-binding protein [Chloroflexota bacterium]